MKLQKAIDIGAIAEVGAVPVNDGIAAKNQSNCVQVAQRKASRGDVGLK
jgi:hypothetical protein